MSPLKTSRERHLFQDIRHTSLKHHSDIKSTENKNNSKSIVKQKVLALAVVVDVIEAYSYLRTSKPASSRDNGMCVHSLENYACKNLYRVKAQSPRDVLTNC